MGTYVVLIVTTEMLPAEQEIFIQYFSQLVTSLPVKSISQHFVQDEIISLQEQQEIFKAASAYKAAGLLLTNIFSAVKIGVPEVFYIFLNIAEKYGTIDCINVIKAMKKRLKSEFNIEGKMYNYKYNTVAITMCKYKQFLAMK